MQPSGKFRIIFLDAFGELRLRFFSLRLRPEVQIAHRCVELSAENVLQGSRKQCADNFLILHERVSQALQQLDIFGGKLGSSRLVIFILVAEDSRTECRRGIRQLAPADAKHLFRERGAANDVNPYGPATRCQIIIFPWLSFSNVTAPGASRSNSLCGFADREITL